MNLAEATFERVVRESLVNERRNRPYIRHSVSQLSRYDLVTVVANGPSLADSLAMLAAPPKRPVIVAVDGAATRLLAAGVVPSLIVTADPHPRIAHWFGAEPDEHFQRTGEVAPTFSMKGLNLAIATASHPETAHRAMDAGLNLYWWNAMLDDPAEDGLTRALNANGLPSINGGGNVGTAAWVIAHSILKAKTVALVGFDFGYPPDFPPQRAQYWPEMQEMGLGFTTYENGWYADPAMAWFRDVFMQMAKDAPCRTINCTEGGTLYGIERMPLAECLS